MQHKDLFKKILQHTTQLAHLQSTLSLLHWDQETMMPKKAFEARAQQISLIASLIHERKNDAQFQKNVEKLIDISSGTYKTSHLSLEEKACLREWRRSILEAQKLPASFIQEEASHFCLAQETWIQARKENAFEKFLPFLEKTVELSQKKAEYLGYFDHPYDALIDEHEPGMTTKILDPLFAELKKVLIPLAKQLQSLSIDTSCLQGTYPKAQQMELGQQVFKMIGMSQDYSRLDLSTHPFSSSLHPTDSRITSRIDEKDLFSNLSSVLHECGHSFYELGMKIEAFGSPLAEACSLGIHESQSRFWETRIGLSKGFWQFFYPALQKTFKKQLGDVSLDHLYQAIHAVKPNYIRVESDEVTYCLHVILRYEIEKALTNGSCKAKDVPNLWKQKMEEFLDLTPPSDTLGCLQDTHWSSCTFGYFPTYALGNIYAAQFFDSFAKDHPDWQIQLGQGEFGFVRSWLKSHIHEKGKLYRPQTLLQHVSGSSLTAKPYLTYLQEKYAKIYGLQNHHVHA